MCVVVCRPAILRPLWITADMNFTKGFRYTSTEPRSPIAARDCVFQQVLLSRGGRLSNQSFRLRSPSPRLRLLDQPSCSRTRRLLRCVRHEFSRRLFQEELTDELLRRHLHVTLSGRTLHLLHHL